MVNECFYHMQFSEQELIVLTVDCVIQLTIDGIDRIPYDRRWLMRVRADCVDQLTVDRINTIKGYSGE